MAHRGKKLLKRAMKIVEIFVTVRNVVRIDNILCSFMAERSMVDGSLVVSQLQEKYLTR